MPPTRKHIRHAIGFSGNAEGSRLTNAKTAAKRLRCRFYSSAGAGLFLIISKWCVRQAPLFLSFGRSQSGFLHFSVPASSFRNNQKSRSCLACFSAADSVSTPNQFDSDLAQFKKTLKISSRRAGSPQPTKFSSSTQQEIHDCSPPPLPIGVKSLDSSNVPLKLIFTDHPGLSSVQTSMPKLCSQSPSHCAAYQS